MKYFLILPVIGMLLIFPFAKTIWHVKALNSCDQFAVAKPQVQKCASNSGAVEFLSSNDVQMQNRNHSIKRDDQYLFI